MKTHNTGQNDTPITCYRCGGPHKQNVRKVKKEDVTCSKCNRQGHMTKAWQSRNNKLADNGSPEKNFARATPST